MKSIITEVRDKALATIKKYEMITKGMSIVIGFSGGPDSLCLFDLLLALKDEYKLNLYPVHINHNLRGQASDDDQRFCEEFSKSKGLYCDVYSFDCASTAKSLGITTEEAGRKFRYDSFMKVAQKAKNEHSEHPVAIAVAQNADDQAETILMRIIRGTGTDGLSGIPYKRLMRDVMISLEEMDDESGSQEARDDVYVIRPLLDVYKKEILEYCDESGLDPRFDHTNDEAIYSRNKVRIELIPELEEEYNPGIKDALRRLASAASEDREFLDAVSRIVFEHALVSIDAKSHHDIEAADSASVTMDRLALKDEHPAIRRRVISMALKAAGLAEDVGKVHYEALEELINSERPSAKTDLPNSYSAWRVYDNLIIGKKCVASDKSNQEAGSGLSKHFVVRELSLAQLDALEKVPNTYAAFDLDLMKKEFGENAISLLEFRGRRPGDILKSEGGTKKIQDLLVDMKVPKAERDDVMLATIGNQVLWAIPSGADIKPRYSSKWKITSETKDIAYIVLLV